MAIMVIGGGPSGGGMAQKSKRIESIGEDEGEGEEEMESSGTGTKEHAASLVADALGIDVNPRELAKALESFVSACKGN